MKIAIKTENLWYTYPNGVTALKGINLEIFEGEIIAIVGGNGAGKTTLVKHFNGLLKPTKGRVIVDGLDTRKASTYELVRRVGLVFQNPLYQLFSESVEKEIALGPKLIGFSSEKLKDLVDSYLKTFNLERYREIHPLKLSEGERKRLCIASILSMNPKIIILDEPTLGQDVKEKERLIRLINELKRKNKTMIVVSHDVEFISEFVDGVVLMCDGRIAANATREVFYRKDLINKASLIEPQIVRLGIELSKLGFKNRISTYEEALKTILGLLK